MCRFRRALCQQNQELDEEAKIPGMGEEGKATLTQTSLIETMVSLVNVADSTLYLKCNLLRTESNIPSPHRESSRA